MHNYRFLIFYLIIPVAWVLLQNNEGVSMTLKPDNGEMSNTLGMTFVYVEHGKFMMGSPSNEPGRDDDEKQYPVTLTKGFYMQTSEVTVGQFRRFVQETGYKTDAETGGGSYVQAKRGWEKKPEAYWDSPGFSQTENHPVTCVSYNDARAFIKWLNQKEGGNGYQLPTEAQWEYACRAGSLTALANGALFELQSRKDDHLNEMGWYSFDMFMSHGGSITHEVAQKKPNSWGLYDMHGNVYEWCRSRYGAYPTGSATDPVGPLIGDFRVVRGGCWGDLAKDCRSANRGRCPEDYRDITIGFRIIKAP